MIFLYISQCLSDADFMSHRMTLRAYVFVPLAGYIFDITFNYSNLKIDTIGISFMHRVTSPTVSMQLQHRSDVAGASDR